MGELGKKRNPGILGYDPKKKRPPMKQLDCPYCWYAHHNKSVLTRHINDQHWMEKEKDDKKL